MCVLLFLSARQNTKNQEYFYTLQIMVHIRSWKDIHW